MRLSLAREKFFSGQTPDQLVKVLALRKNGSANTPFLLEAETLVEADRGCVVTVNRDSCFLVAQLLEIVAQDNPKRVSSVALVAVLLFDVETPAQIAGA